MSRSKKIAEPDPIPKINPKGPKKGKKAQNGVEWKVKDRAVLPKPKVIVYICIYQKNLNFDFPVSIIQFTISIFHFQF